MFYFRNTSLALAPAPTLDSSTVSAPVIGRGPTPTVQKSVELTGAGEGIVVNFGGYKTVVAKEPEPEVALEQKPSSTFLTDLADNNEPGNWSYIISCSKIGLLFNTKGPFR